MPRTTTSPWTLDCSSEGSVVNSRSSSSLFSTKGVSAAGIKRRVANVSTTSAGNAQVTMVPEGKTKMSPWLVRPRACTTSWMSKPVESGSREKLCEVKREATVDMSKDSATQTAEIVERPSGSVVWSGIGAGADLAGLPFWATMATRWREFLSGSLRFCVVLVVVVVAEDLFCCWEVVESSAGECFSVEGFWVVVEGEEDCRDGSLLLLLPFCCARRPSEVKKVRFCGRLCNVVRWKGGCGRVEALVAVRPAAMPERPRMAGR